MRGTVLNGRYRLLRLLGAGAMSLVYEAEDMQLERFVAVKVLRPELAADPARRAAFHAEAQAAAGLHHPGLANVYDAGHEGDTVYIVMERVQGAPLDETGGRDLDAALHTAAQVAAALAFVHRTGLVHCDVKPGNILVDDQLRAKLVDFGVACALDAPAAEAEHATSAATRQLPIVRTTPGGLPYLAPERIAGAAPSPSGDVYSLGAVLYYLLAGRPPYQGSGVDEIERAQRAGPPPRLRELNPLVPATVAGLVERSLHPDPARRFGSADEFLAAIEQVREQSRVSTSAMSTLPPALAASTLAAQQAPQPQAAVAGAVPPPAARGAAVPLADGYAAASTPALGSAQPAVAAGPLFVPAAPAGRAPVLAGALRGSQGRLLLVLGGVLLLGLLVAALALANRGGSTTEARAASLATATADSGLAVAGATQTAAPTQTPASMQEPTPAAPALVAVPELRGMTLEQARAAARQIGVTLVEAEGVHSDNVQAGLIMSQAPEPGAEITVGSPVTVAASLGPAPQPEPQPASNPELPPPPSTDKDEDKKEDDKKEDDKKEDDKKEDDKGDDKGKGENKGKKK